MKASFNFNTLLFFLFCFSFIFNEKKLKPKIMGANRSTKIQEPAVISVNIRAKKEGIVPKTTYTVFIRIPLIHSDSKLKAIHSDSKLKAVLSKKKKKKSFVQQVCPKVLLQSFRVQL